MLNFLVVIGVSSQTDPLHVHNAWLGNRVKNQYTNTYISVLFIIPLLACRCRGIIMENNKRKPPQIRTQDKKPRLGGHSSISGDTHTRADETQGRSLSTKLMTSKFVNENQMIVQSAVLCNSSAGL